MNSQYKFDQFIAGMLDGTVLFFTVFFMVTKSHYTTGYVAICLWIGVRVYVRNKGIIPYPWDGSDWNNKASPTVCPDCGAEISVEPRQYICSNYPDCEYVGKGVIPEETEEQ